MTQESESDPEVEDPDPVGDAVLDVRAGGSEVSVGGALSGAE